MINPCKKDCPNRTIRCHGECEKYLEFNRNNVERGNERIKRIAINEFSAENTLKVQRRYNKKGRQL